MSFVTGWALALYGMTVLAAALVFGYDEYRHNTRPDSVYEWLARAGSLMVVSVLWWVVLATGWRRQRVVPAPPPEPVELKAYAFTTDPVPDAEPWGQVMVDEDDPLRRLYQKKPCGCARHESGVQFVWCARHSVDEEISGEEVLALLRDYDDHWNPKALRDLVSRGQLRYSGNLGEWQEKCGCRFVDENREAVVRFCRKHGPGLPRCACRWDARKRRTVSCLDHENVETPPSTLYPLPRSPQPGEVCRVGATVFGFDGLEWARVEPMVEEGA